MQNNIIFLIVVHDIRLIEFFESAGKYSKLDNYKYLLVGQHAENYQSDKIVQCCLLPDHIEQYKNYLAYTGWYAAVRNPDIIKGYDYVCFLEYDTDVDAEFSLQSFTNKVAAKNLNCYGLTWMSTHAGLFERSHFTTKLISFLLKEGHGEIKPNCDNWITTNNVVFKQPFLIEYFNDKLTRDFFEYLGNDKMSGHFLERYLSVYCFIRSIQFGIIENSSLVHRGLDSHNTQNIYHSPRGYEQFKTANKISN